ncbi:MAG TPA: type II secretion system protein GspM [Variovorax sp.]
MKWLDLLQARWQAWWPDLGAREQRLVIGAAALLVLALLWWVALAPALHTLSVSASEHARLDAQLQQMTQLRNQAKALQAQPRASRDDALRGLEASVHQNLGPNAQLQGAGAGEGLTVALRGVPAASLAQWLTQARSNARAVPREVHLTRNAQNAPATASAAESESSRVRWDGTLTMGVPAR